ncbi:MAG: hypothetical protein JSV81_16490 [Anaerolineales bacterium]|nr:MAG: hypothetical protein JSV81_16490 [Anaerolineales bacterium]
MDKRDTSKDPEYPAGLYVLPMTGEEMEVTRPEGWGYPLLVQVRWVTSNPGRDALTQMLADVLFLEWDRVTLAVAAGETYALAPLRELAQRPGWQIESRLPEAPDKCRLAREGEPPREGMRLDLLRALELTLRCSLKPFEHIASWPNWVEPTRQAYQQLLLALQGHALFQPAFTPVAD